MSYIAERREEEKERRRGEILDAAESLYAKHGWDGLTIDQVARTARLSRALVYVYFKDKEDLLYGVGERALSLLRDRFVAAVRTSPGNGLAQVEAIFRAYTAYALEFPHYFDFMARFHQHPTEATVSPNEAACHHTGDSVFACVVQAIEAGVRDGSIHVRYARKPLMTASSLWAFALGATQICMAKARELARLGVSVPELGDYIVELLRTMLTHAPQTPRG